MKLPGGIRDFGHTRERAALALLGLSFFCVVYGLIALGPPPELLLWRAAFAGLAGCYVTAFVALAAGWFWGRWFVSGLAWSGAMLGLTGLVTLGWQMPLAVYGGVHGAVALLVAGPRMAQCYEAQPAWRQRFGLDEFGAARLGRYISRFAAALPGIVLWLSAPREQSLVGPACVALLVVGGCAGVLRGRAWGLFATAAAAVALGTVGMASEGSPRLTAGWEPVLTYAAGSSGATVGAVLLAAAVVPFFAPALRYFRSLPK